MGGSRDHASKGRSKDDSKNNSKASSRKASEGYLLNFSRIRDKARMSAAELREELELERRGSKASDVPLRLVPLTENQLSTTIYAEHTHGRDETRSGASSESAAWALEDDNTSQTSLRNRGEFQVWRSQQVVVQVEHTGKRDERNHGQSQNEMLRRVDE